MSYRAQKSGIARDQQLKLRSSFDPAECQKCLEWIQDVTGEIFEIALCQQEEKDRSCDNLYNVLKDGMLLCKLIDCLLPEDEKLDFSKKTFQVSGNPVFATARERERIGLFLNKIQEFGVDESMSFQTQDLYERTNLNQVCITIRATGMEAQVKSYYQFSHIWPKKHIENRRRFSEEQLMAGRSIISLQYGTNKGASQAGMTFGKQRKIID